MSATFWIHGEWTDDSGFDFCGVYSTRAGAVEACLYVTDFIFPSVVDTGLPRDVREVIADCEYPVAAQLQAIIAQGCSCENRTCPACVALAEWGTQEEERRLFVLSHPVDYEKEK